VLFHHLLEHPPAYAAEIEAGRTDGIDAAPVHDSHHPAIEPFACQIAFLYGFDTPEGEKHVGLFARCGSSDGDVEGSHHLVHVATHYDYGYAVVLCHFILLEFLIFAKFNGRQLPL
jgi:hypothetical protein